MKFQLTKHRELWEWLAENLSGEDGKLMPEEYLSKYKEKWFSVHDEPRIYNNCYACDYAVKFNVEHPCKSCPLWYDCKTGIYEDLLDAIMEQDDETIYNCCILFHNSPIKKGVEVE